MILSPGRHVDAIEEFIKYYVNSVLGPYYTTCIHGLSKVRLTIYVGLIESRFCFFCSLSNILHFRSLIEYKYRF